MSESTLNVECLSVGFLETNCYIVYDIRSKQAVIIDPGAEEEKILFVIKKYNFSVLSLVHTHGHFDHIGSSRTLKKETGAKILLHKADAFMVKDVTVDLFIKESDSIAVGDFTLIVTDTPGHTPGGISLVGPACVFTGDTLFHHAVGRTDLPGGNEHTLWDSIYQKIFKLPDSFTVYPGHGPFSTIFEEKNVWKK